MGPHSCSQSARVVRSEVNREDKVLMLMLMLSLGRTKRRLNVRGVADENGEVLLNLRHRTSDQDVWITKL